MQLSTRRIVIPAAAIGVIVVAAVVVLLIQQGAMPACGAYAVTADAPLALDGAVSVSIPAGAGELRFDGAVLAEADLAGDASAQVRAALNALPVNLRLQGSILTFARCGETAIPIHLESPAPDASLDAYAWDGARWTWLAGATDKLSVDLPDLPLAVAWAQGLPTAPTIGTHPDPQTGGLAPEYHGIITELYAPGLTVAANGSVTGQVPAAPPEGAPHVMYALVTNVTDGQADTASVEAMLNDEAARETHIEALASIAGGSNLAGIAIDYRGWTPQAHDTFASLVENLAAALHEKGRQLVVVLPGKSATGSPFATDPDEYDWARIGRAADMVQMLLPIEVGSYPLEGESASFWNRAATLINRNKIQAVTSAASARTVSGSLTPASFSETLAALIDAPPSTLSATVGVSLTLNLGVYFDSNSGAYSNGVLDGEIRVHTAATLAAKLNALSGLRLRGVVIRDVQGPDVAPNLLEPIEAYRQQGAITGSSELNVEWTITAADGSTVLSETRPLADADLVWTPDREGTFTVKTTIASVRRDVVRVTVDAGETASGGAEPTPTVGSCHDAAYVADVSVPDKTRFDKNAEFIKTWRVRNSGTCAWSADTKLAFVSGSQLGAASPVTVGALDVSRTIDISVPMKALDQDGAYTGIWQLRNEDGAFGGQLSVVIQVGAQVAAPPPVAPPAGGGRTEYGIHAHFYGYIDADAGARGITGYINELGLGWTKIQFRWGDYDYYCSGPDLNVLNTMISRAGEAGLKVMLSVVTAPPCTHPWTDDVHAPPDDPAKLAELVGGLSDLFRGRIHAIEVWNEQNISREWKTSPQKLDANRYTQMLAAAYNAIKSKDPNILVISGGLAPTGWNDGVNATDDFLYLQQMVAAGATKYMDCVGTHVNALRVPASAGLGGQYDSLFSPPHHSWYFKDTVVGYHSITGKPACVTEFGVASTETIGSVAGFEWAAENTQQEQADWVTEGMALCRQWGCRLVILWNLDYGPATRLVNDNALYSFIDIGLGRRPVFAAVKNWCAANGCR